MAAGWAAYLSFRHSFGPAGHCIDSPWVYSFCGMSGDQPPIRVAVTGATGYVGGELLRLLQGHPHVSVGAVTGSSSVGSTPRRVTSRICTDLPNGSLRRLPQPRWPTTTSSSSRCRTGNRRRSPRHLVTGTRIIDCGADFRLDDPDAWATFYGSEHAGSWPYGLARTAGCTRVVGRRHADRGARVLPDRLRARAGSRIRQWTGRAARRGHRCGIRHVGRWPRPRANLMASEVMGGMSPYGVGGVHRHTPEIEQSLARGRR